MTREQEIEHERKLEAARKRWDEEGRKPTIREIFGDPVRINGMTIDTAISKDQAAQQEDHD